MIKIKSKYYIPSPPSIGSVLLSVLTIIVFVVMLFAGMFVMIMDGFSLSLFVKICAAGIVAFMLLPASSSGDYIFADADVMIDVKGALNILYKSVALGKDGVKDVWFIIDPAQLANMEYSDKLNAIRFTGKILNLIGEKERMLIPEYIFYIEDGNIDEIKTLIETNTPMKLEFVDRRA